MSADVQSVIADLAARFGPGCSSGVAAILLHDSLPEQFDKAEWSDWFFKPSPAAFEWAHDRGLITPYKLSSKWAFTDLGRDTAAEMQSLAKEPTP